MSAGVERKTPAVPALSRSDACLQSRVQIDRRVSLKLGL